MQHRRRTGVGQALLHPVFGRRRSTKAIRGAAAIDAGAIGMALVSGLLAAACLSAPALGAMQSEQYLFARK